MVDLQVMAVQYRWMAQRARLGCDWCDDAESKVREARSDTGVVGANRLAAETDESFTSGRATIEEVAGVLDDFRRQCLWRAGEIDEYLRRRGHAERARATHMAAEHQAAEREGRNPTERFAPVIPQPPHGWMRGS